MPTGPPCCDVSAFDLTGLPPTPEELASFENDPSPVAYERQVDRLLASPRYGERWAQHWLDLARYADTDGFEFDEARPNMWRYRDWVVAALNADIPYDEFVRTQLAGDEVSPDDPSAFIATGFNRCYPDMVDLNDQGLRRQNSLQDITETTGLVFLGLTIGCARCHDHKFDPISQADYFQLQAFFTPARFVDDEAIASETEQAIDRQNRSAWKRRLAALEAERGAARSDETRKQLDTQLARWKRSDPPPPPTARGLKEEGREAAPTYLLERGDYEQKGPVVAPAFPASSSIRTTGVMV